VIEVARRSDGKVVAIQSEISGWMGNRGWFKWWAFALYLL